MYGVEYTKMEQKNKHLQTGIKKSEIQPKTSRMFYNAMKSKFQTQKRPWRTFPGDKGITVSASFLFS